MNSVSLYVLNPKHVNHILHLKAVDTIICMVVVFLLMRPLASGNDSLLKGCIFLMENQAELMTVFAEKQYRMQKLQTIVTVCILIVLLIAILFIAIQFTSINHCIGLIEADLQALDAEMLENAVSSFTDAANQFASVDMDELNRTVLALQSAAKSFGSMDTDELNGAIVSLREAAASFNDVDIKALNALVNSLETVAARLERTLNLFPSIFGRS